MRRRVVDHAALPMLAVGLAIMLLLSLGIYRAKEDSTLVLEDIAGSKEALGEAIISGELRDGYHAMTFTARQDKVVKETVLFDQPQLARSNSYIAGEAKRVGNKEYEVYGSGPFEIVARDISGLYPVPAGKANVAPVLTFNGSRLEGQVSRYSNPLEYGLAVDGEDVYYTTPVTTDYTGSSSIFKLAFYEWGYPQPPDATDSHELTAIPLGVNGLTEEEAVQVLGLEAVDGKLVVVMTKGGMLQLTAYDAASGQLLGELEVPGVSIGDAVAAESSSYGARYQAYADSEQQQLNLSFSQTTSDGKLYRMLLTVEVADRIALIHQVRADFSDGADNMTVEALLSMRSVEGRLIILRQMEDNREGHEEIEYSFARPKRLLIEVYDRGEIVYKGEIRSDWNDDVIRARRVPAQLSFRYDPLDYRFFDHLQIKDGH